MGGKFPYGFPVRHRSPSGHPGYDYALADAGQGIFHPKRCRGSAEGADSGTYIISYPPGVQTVHLFPYGTVEAGISGVKAHRGKTVPFRLFHHFQDLLQVHGGAVINPGILPGPVQKLPADQGTRVYNHICLRQESLPPDRNQINRTWTCSYYMYHLIPPFICSSFCP